MIILQLLRLITTPLWVLPGWRFTVSLVNGSSFNSTGRSADGSKDIGYAATTTMGSDGGWRDAGGFPISEIGHIYSVNLGDFGLCPPAPTLDLCFSGSQLSPQPGWGLSNTGSFVNIQPGGSIDNFYWSDTSFGSGTALNFLFFSGFQETDSKGREFFAWAVHSGDVSVVPVPGSAVWERLVGFGEVIKAKNFKANIIIYGDTTRKKAA